MDFQSYPEDSGKRLFACVTADDCGVLLPLELSPLSLHNPLGWPRSGKTISSSNRLGDPERVM